MIVNIDNSSVIVDDVQYIEHRGGGALVIRTGTDKQFFEDYTRYTVSNRDE